MVNLKKLAMVVATLALFSVPTQAGSFGAYGSYWTSDDADNSWGAGARVGFNFAKWLELEFHGTYYPDFGAEVFAQNIEVRAIPVDGGLKVNFLPGKMVNPYAGLGGTYYFLDTDQGDIDNETGIYGEAGLDFGKENARFFVEAMWRKLDTSVRVSSFDQDVTFDGIDWHAGVVWRWGK
jgi:outer membrane protein W